MVVKLADFGLRGLTSHSTLDANTLPFMAPEILNKDPYHPKADVYSFGMVLWFLAAQKLPYQNMHPRDIIAHVTSGRREIIPRDCPGDLASLIKQCWAQNPDERPDFSLLVRELQISQ